MSLRLVVVAFGVAAWILVAAPVSTGAQSGPIASDSFQLTDVQIKAKKVDPPTIWCRRVNSGDRRPGCEFSIELGLSWPYKDLVALVQAKDESGEIVITPTVGAFPVGPSTGPTLQRGPTRPYCSVFNLKARIPPEAKPDVHSIDLSFSTADNVTITAKLEVPTGVVADSAANKAAAKAIRLETEAEKPRVAINWGVGARPPAPLVLKVSHECSQRYRVQVVGITIDSPAPDLITIKPYTPRGAEADEIGYTDSREIRVPIERGPGAARYWWSGPPAEDMELKVHVDYKLGCGPSGENGTYWSGKQTVPIKVAASVDFGLLFLVGFTLVGALIGACGRMGLLYLSQKSDQITGRRGGVLVAICVALGVLAVIVCYVTGVEVRAGKLQLSVPASVPGWGFLIGLFVAVSDPFSVIKFLHGKTVGVGDMMVEPGPAAGAAGGHESPPPGPVVTAESRPAGVPSQGGADGNNG